MRTPNWIHRFRSSTWGLPLILPLLLMPVSLNLSVRLWITEGYAYLIYLPLAMMIGMLLVFDWRAFPGIALALVSYYFQRYTPGTASVIVMVFLFVLMACWRGYKMNASRRWSVAYAELRLMPLRLLWLIVVIPTLFILLLQVMALTGIMPLHGSVFARSLFSIQALLNFQSVLLSCITMTHLYYCFIRLIYKPFSFTRLIFLKIKNQIAPGVSRYELMSWIALTALLLVMFTGTHTTEKNLLATDYGVPLLLPLLLWSAMRFGYILTSLSWGTLLILLYQLRDRFLHAYTEPYHLAVMSANLLVFSLTVLLMAAISTRQRRMLAIARDAALNDPVMKLPNLRALSLALTHHQYATLCFLSIPALDRLSRTYGLRMRIQYKRSLAHFITPLLMPGEEVYQLPGYDLVIRLQPEGHKARIDHLDSRLKEYHLSWDGLPIHPAVGLSYCRVRSPVEHLHELLGELSAMAEMSLKSGMAENLQPKNGLSAQRRVEEKVAQLEAIQRALRTDDFQLKAGKVSGVRGDDYYEVTLCMGKKRCDPVSPANLEEFGLTWEIDRWVIEHTLAFIDAQRATHPGLRFAIKLFDSTLCRSRLAQEIEVWLHTYQVEPWQLIIQVQESPVQTHYSWGNRTIAQLRALGCRVAIDDLGSGYASYARLKAIQVDMLIIESRFVRNILNDSLDYQIIQSLCAMARLKHMQVVARSVENDETEQTLRKLGVDFMQKEEEGRAFFLSEWAEKHAPATAESAAAGAVTQSLT